MRLGLLHPGSMGVTVGRAAALRAEVLWASERRSPATADRAAAAGFTDTGTLTELVRASDAIVSVVPPAAAESCAREVAEAGFDGIYVDANAISPHRTRQLQEILVPATFVDGGLIGPPAITAGSTRLYLAGSAAETIVALFEGSVLDAIDLGADVGAASALKMAYAAYTKGSTALVMAVRALAEHHDLTDALLAEWALSLPELPDQSDGMLRRSPKKAWRFSGEMREIAETFRAAGLPGEFHDAAFDIFERIGPEGAETDPAEVLRRIGDAGSRG